MNKRSEPVAAADGPPHFGSHSIKASGGGPPQSRSFGLRGRAVARVVKPPTPPPLDWAGPSVFLAGSAEDWQAQLERAADLVPAVHDALLGHGWFASSAIA